MISIARTVWMSSTRSVSVLGVSGTTPFAISTDMRCRLAIAYRAASPLSKSSAWMCQPGSSAVSRLCEPMWPRAKE